MRKFLTIVILFSITLSGSSQTWKLKRFEVFGGVSVLQYFGDIGGTSGSGSGISDFSIKANRPGINFGGTYRVYEGFYLQATNTIGLLARSDKGSRNYRRDFAFYSIIDELSVQGSFFIIKEKKNYYFSIMRMRGGFRKINRPISMYVFAGAGAVYFKSMPKDKLVGSPRYVSKSLSMTVPCGLGFKFAYSPDFSVGLELGARMTLTDYLDGVTSSFSKHNDIYYILNVKVNYRISKLKDINKLFR